MQWYQILPLILSILTFFGIGSFFSLLWKEMHERKKQESAQEKARLKKEKQDEMREVIREEIASLKEDICELKKTDEIQKKSIQAMLRDRLYELHSIVCKQGYTTLSQRENFENMYIQYHSLGRNGVMDTIREEFFSFPTEEAMNNKKKTLLLENSNKER